MSAEVYLSSNGLVLPYSTGLGEVEYGSKYANKKHREQRYGGTDVSHAYHRSKVALFLLLAKYNAHIVTGGENHDVVEDTSVTYEEIKSEFPDPVCQGIRGMTNTFDPDELLRLYPVSKDNMKESKRLVGLEQAVYDPITALLKYVDSKDNGEATLVIPKKDGDSGRRRLDYIENQYTLAESESGILTPEEMDDYIRDEFGGKMVDLGRLSVDDRLRLAAKYRRRIAHIENKSILR